MQRLLRSIFGRVRTGLASRDLIACAAMLARLAAALVRSKAPPFDFAVVDEAQDLDAAQLRFLAALGVHRLDALCFRRGIGRRIFRGPFSWQAPGVDVRGRSRNPHVNRRTSHQIRVPADRLFGPAVSDADGNTERRGDTVSVFDAPPPYIRPFKTPDEEIDAVGDWIAARAKDGEARHEFGVFVRSAAELDRARAAVRGSGLASRILDQSVETTGGHVSVGIMRLGRGWSSGPRS